MICPQTNLEEKPLYDEMVISNQKQSQNPFYFHKNTVDTLINGSFIPFNDPFWKEKQQLSVQSNINDPPESLLWVLSSLKFFKWMPSLI